MQTYPEWLADLEKLMAEQTPPMSIDEVEPADLYAAYKAGAKVEPVVRQLAAKPPPAPPPNPKPAPQWAAPPRHDPPSPWSFVFAGIVVIVILAELVGISGANGESEVLKAGPPRAASKDPEPEAARPPSPAPPEPEDPAVALLRIEDESRAKVQVVGKTAWTGGDFNYDSVKGTIHNGGKLPVSYWVVTVKFYDKAGNVIDSEFTNGAQPLYPGESKRWSIMHETDKAEKKYTAAVTEVRF